MWVPSLFWVPSPRVRPGLALRLPTVLIRTIAFDVRVTALPELGRTYSFTVPVAQDAAVQVIYGYDKLLVPGGQPVTIRANVRNAGTAALGAVTATLNITGANTYTATQTVPSLAVNGNSVVSFANVPVPAAATTP